MKETGIIHIHQHQTLSLVALYSINIIGILSISYCFHQIFEYVKVTVFLSIILQAIIFDFGMYLLYSKKIVTDYIIVLGEIIELTFSLSFGVQKKHICYSYNIIKAMVNKSNKPYFMEIIYRDDMSGNMELTYIKFQSFDEAHDYTHALKNQLGVSKFHIT
jgi:hypothetical protein